MNNISYENLLEIEWKKRYSELDKDVRNKLDILEDYLNNGDCEKYTLIKIQRSYKKPEKGDIFVFQPREKIYFLGLVINSHISNSYGKEMYIVVLFKDKTNKLKIKDFTPNYENLLLPPLMVTRLNWTKGFFYNIGHTNELGNTPDYGFYRPMYIHKYWNEYDEKLNHKPKYLSIGTTTVTGIGYRVNRELIIDNSILS